MDARLLFLPAIMALVIGVADQLEDIAMSASDKAVDMSESMSNAMDCAAVGISIYDCSPELRTTDFSSEREQFRNVLEDLQRGNSTDNTTDLTSTPTSLLV